MQQNEGVCAGSPPFTGFKKLSKGKNTFVLCDKLTVFGDKT